MDFKLEERSVLLNQLPRAIVPVLKYVYWRSGIECDISIENKDGI